MRYLYCIMYILGLFSSQFVVMGSDLSIILPIDGYDDQVLPCLKSLIHDPMFSHYELLLIHMAPSERTQKDIEPFINEYSNILYIQLLEPNLLSAINLAVSLAQSPYLIKIFSNMRVKQYGFDLMLEEAKEHGYRVICGSYFYLEDYVDDFYDMYKRSLNKELVSSEFGISELSPVLWEKSLHQEIGLFFNSFFLHYFNIFFSTILKKNIKIQSLNKVVFTVSGKNSFGLDRKNLVKIHPTISEQIPAQNSILDNETKMQKDVNIKKKRRKISKKRPRKKRRL